MQNVIYVVRHCQAAGQAQDAPLTEEGVRQARQLADQLAKYGIERLVASPYTRAVQSIAPLAQRLGLRVHTDARLAERVLSSEPLEDWQAALRATFEDLDRCYPGGETSRAAMRRAVAALDEIAAHLARISVVVTHGNLMTLLLKQLDPAIGFAFWQQLTTPDLYRVKLGSRTTVQRVAPEVA